MAISSESFTGETSPCGRCDRGTAYHEHVPDLDGHAWQRQTSFWQCGCSELVEAPCGHANGDEPTTRQVTRCDAPAG